MGHPVPTRRNTVLIVDDDPLVAETIAEQLARHGHHPLCAEDIDSAYDLVQSERPAALVLDQIVPCERSMELLGWLCELGEAAPHVVVLRYMDEPFMLHPRISVVGGEEWFERLPAALARRLEAQLP